MKVFVTGACGMLGTEICRELGRLGDQVVPVDLQVRYPGVQALDICQFFDLQSLVERERPEAIFHLAARVELSRSHVASTFRRSRQS